MSSIFKQRKIPKHLIIQDDYEFRHKPRLNLWRLVRWVVLASLLTVAFLQVSSTFALSFN